MIERIRDPIAERTLIAGNEAVVIVIGKPTPAEDIGDFHCPYSIEGFGQKKFSYAGGADAVQALQLALKKIGFELEHMARSKRIEISWLPDTPGQTGFE